MIKTARLNIKWSDAEGASMEDVLKKAMKKAKITMADIEVNGKDYSSRTHFGNWVLTPVLDNEASAKIAAVMGTKLDYQQQILEAADIAAFKCGDKVALSFIGDLGFAAAKLPGKVLRAMPPINTPDYKHEGEIAILKKGSRTKGWSFKPGDFVTIEKV